MRPQHTSHHSHMVTTLIDWEHAHDEMVKAVLVVAGFILIMVALGLIASKIDAPMSGMYQQQYYYMPYY